MPASRITTYFMSIQTPFNEFATTVQPDWIDSNGHMNVAYYHLVFDLAATPFFSWLGFTEENRKVHNISTFALETHLNYLAEVKVNAGVRVESRVIDVTERRVHFFQQMYKCDGGQLSATHEALGTVVDMSKRKSTNMPDVIYERIRKVKAAHSQLDLPWQVGHVMSVNAKPNSKTLDSDRKNHT